ncbi:hypothetical protein ACPYO6_13015 [Georgenia sp. Z1344]|uniref:hypothetical protein n=1 Tax=Georgenia sp. Z1344 TaxID=3416706 RepID=UPI003CF35F14
MSHAIDAAEVPSPRPAPTPSPRRITLLTAAVAVTAVILHIQLHEYAHAVTAVLLVGSSTVHGAMADHPPASDADLALIAMAGPVFSVVLGLLAWAASRPMPSGYARALLTWIGLSSIQGAFGYLMIALVAPVGDTAVAFEAWGLGIVWSIASFVVGVAGMFLCAYLLAREIGRTFETPAPFRSASVWTWLVATAAILAIYGGVAVLAGLDGELFAWTIIGPSTALVFAPMATIFWKAVPYRRRPWSVGATPVVVAGLVVAVAIVAVHAIVGVELG